MAPGCVAPATPACRRYRALADNVDPLLEVDGRGRTIAVVDAFGAPDLASDLHHFDAAFRLPDPELSVIHPAGAPPAFDPRNPERALLASGLGTVDAAALVDALRHGEG